MAFREVFHVVAHDDDLYWPDPQRLVPRDPVQLQLKAIGDVIRTRIPPPDPLVCVALRTYHGQVDTPQVVITISGDTIEQVIADALRGVSGDPVDYGE